jgi:hypothetical protein
MNRLARVLLALSLPAATWPAAGAADVTLREGDRTVLLDNGILDVRIEKQSGEVLSIR